MSNEKRVRFVYVTESVGDATGLDMIFSTPGKAVKRLREYFAVTVPRGSVSQLKNGGIVWAHDKEIDGNIGCAMRVRVR